MVNIYFSFYFWEETVFQHPEHAAS